MTDEIEMGLKECKELRDWFIANGGHISPLIELTWSVEHGQHFVASNDLAGSDEPLCVCPHRLTLSHLNVQLSCPADFRNASEASVCAKLVGKVPASTIRYFFLVEQRLLGEKSFWWPYINSLPREADMSTPLWFDDSDLLWLAGTTLHSSMDDPTKSAVMLRKDMWINEWTTGRNVLKSENVDVEPYTWSVHFRD